MNEVVYINSDSSGCFDVDISTDGSTLKVSLSFFEREIQSSGIVVFDGVMAFSFSGESAASIDSDMFDRVVVMERSGFFDKELGAISFRESVAPFRHFAAYISNFGRLDVLATNVFWEKNCSSNSES